jgi:hypothetical protein
MSNSNDIYNDMQELWEQFSENHAVFAAKGTKAAAARARKAINNLKKLITPYKKQSVEDCK